jgi:hypothetical protein
MEPKTIVSINKSALKDYKLFHPDKKKTLELQVFSVISGINYQLKNCIKHFYS